MSTREEDSGDSDWTTKNIRRLLSEIKRSVPEENRLCSYKEGIKFIQWENVAFPPFSAESCQAKWREISQKIRKIRSLSELINEAEETYPINQKHYIKVKQLEDYNRKTQVCRKQHQESGFRKRLKKDESSVSNADEEQNSEALLPVKPPSTGYNLFCKEQVKHIEGVPKISYCVVLAKRWKALTENERKEYSARCKELKRRYENDVKCCLMTEEEKQTQDQSATRKKLSPQEQKSKEQKHQDVNAFNTASYKGFTRMPSDSEDEDITDDSSNEELYFDSAESEEEKGKDDNMPFMF